MTWHGKIFYPCNMFIMNKELFFQYSKMLFDILDEFEQRCDMSRYSREGLRTPGHLGERMTGIFFEYLKQKGGYRLGQLQTIYRNKEIIKYIFFILILSRKAKMK